MKLLLAFAAVCLVATLQARNLDRRQAKPCPDECEHLPLEIAFVIDASASIWPQNFTIGLWFVQNFVDKFNIGQDKVRVSAVTYGDRVYTENAFGFGEYSDKESLDNAIESIPYPGGRSTQTGAAIKYMLENQLPEAREGVRKVIIVLTDGNSQQPDVTKAEAHKALEAGLEVFAIGVGHAVSEEELHNIASDSKHVFIVGSYQMLDDILDRLAFETCGVQPKPQCQYDPVDIAFVIDSSVSIGKENFTIGLEFIKEFLEDFEINPTAVRVAAVMFGKVVYADSAIPFDAYDDEKDTLDAILNLKWEHGTRTETGLGIDYMVDHFLPHTREHAAHIGIVITDGESQEPDKTATAAQRARDAGAIMFAVGVGKLNSHAHGTLDEAELNSIAGDPSHVLLAEDYSKLDSIREELLHITCSGITTRLEAKGNAK